MIHALCFWGEVEEDVEGLMGIRDGPSSEFEAMGAQIGRQV